MESWKYIKVGLGITLISVFTSSVAYTDGHKGPKNEIIHKALIACQIDYSQDFEPVTDEENNRRLAWIGTIQLNGDIYNINWWFNNSPVIAPSVLTDGAGFIGYYSARWEIMDNDGNLILAGESGGKTVFPTPFPPASPPNNGVWDGHGIVTEAAKHLNALKGSKIYESGSVIFNDGLRGNGIFMIIGP